MATNTTARGAEAAAFSSIAATSSGENQFSNVRVVVRIRPMNSLETSRRSKTSIYPVADPQAEALPPSPPETADAPFVEEKTPPLSPSSDSNKVKPSRKGTKGLLSRLLTPASKSKFGYAKTPPAKAHPLADATPVTRNTSAAQQQPSSPPAKSSLALSVPFVAKSLIAEAALQRDNRHFECDAVFGAASTQRHVYEYSVGDAVRRNIFRGYNTTIIAYGQTGSGKTFTMQGPRDARALAGEAVTPCGKGDSSSVYAVEQDDGVIPRAIHDLFQAKKQHANQVTVELTYIEIYNDELHDLLVDDDRNSLLQLRDHGDKGVNVAGLTKVEVKSVDQAKVLMHEATARRTTASTHLNERSSRSHAICTLLVTTQPAVESSSTSMGAMETTTAKLTLVDLAGSERIKDSGVVGIQKQESININKDLFVLGKVVSALSEKSKKGRGNKTHVPYRDSKLTRLLRDSIGGNCCTVLIACVSPAEHNVDESVNTLRYAERSRTITNSVRQNVLHEALTPAESLVIRAENTNLKAQLAKLQRRMLAEASKSSKSNLFDESLSSDERSVDSGLSGLQAKLKQAGVEAKEARRHSLSVATTADRWRDHFEAMVKSSVSPSMTEDSLSDSHSFDMMLTPSPRGCFSLADDASFQSLGSARSRDTRTRREHASQLKVDVEVMSSQKLDLTVKLAELSEEVKDKESSLLHLKKDFSRQRSSLQDDIQKQERRRNELGTEVDHMKQRIRLLSSDLKEDATELSISSIFRSLSGDRSEDPNEEVEMRTLRDSAPTEKEVYISLERLAHLESIEREVNESKARADQETASIKQELNERETQAEEAAMNHESTTLELKDEKARADQAEKRLNLLQGVEQELFKATTRANKATERLARLLTVERELTEEKAHSTQLEARGRLLAQEVLSMKVISMAKEQLDSNPAEAMKTPVDVSFTPERLAHIQKIETDLSNVKIRCNQFESQCKSLEKDLRCASNEKETLQAEVEDLRAEIDSIRAEGSDGSTKEEPDTPQRSTPGSSVAVLTASLDSKASTSPSKDKENAPITPEHEKIRSHAEKMLSWANKAIEKRRAGPQSVCSSMASSAGTEFRPVTSSPPPQPCGSPKAGKPPMMPIKMKQPEDDTQVVISNLDTMDQMKTCSCESSVFAGNAEHVQFYLPKLGVACTCGKKREVTLTEGSNPCALENILRDWQHEFLASIRIHSAIEFVHAHKERGPTLAKDMRRWRKSKRMVSVKTKSCSIALHIWSRTCKAVVKAVRVQKANGIENLQRPDFMDVTIASDNNTVSTLGAGSGYHIEAGSECEV